MRQLAASVLQSAPLSNWVYSPVPGVERAIHEIRRKYPAAYPSSLTRPLRLLEKLGNPHRRLPFTFHVAGTNGKGSTLAFLQAAFEAAGLRVHKYISPHLVRFEERIILGGKEIAPELLLALVAECDAAAEGEEVSFFEFFTSLAFLAYARHPADALLLETGMGGAFDATNVVEGGPRLVSLLTRVSCDHTHVLGAALPDIAAHKAGIIKRQSPCVIAPQEEGAQAVFLQRAAAEGAQAVLYGRDWKVTPRAGGFEYEGAVGNIFLPPPALLGAHQIYNAGTALAALESSPYAFLLAGEIPARAMRNVVWPGRLQRLTTGPLAALLPAGWELWLDGAHNDSGAEVLADQIKAWGMEKPLHLVTAMKKTKDAAGFYGPLLGRVSSVQAVDVGWIEAPMTAAEDLCAQIRRLGCEAVKTSPNLESALRALAFQFTSAQRILITGSLYLVGHALKE